MEQFASSATCLHVVVVELAWLEMVPFLYQCCRARELLGCHLRYFDLVFDIVVVFLEAEPFHVLGIVRIVVVDVHRGEVVETFDEHPFAIHVLEAKRPGDLRHAFSFSPVGDSLEQCLRDCGVIDEVEPSEAHHLPLPVLVGAAVDDGGDTSCHFPVLISKETPCLTEGKGGVGARLQRELLGEVQVRHGIGTVAIEVIEEVEKSLTLAAVLNRYNLNGSHCLLLT